MIVGTKFLFKTTLIIHLNIKNLQKLSHYGKSITNDRHNALKKKPDPQRMNRIKNSAILKIKIKVNTHTQKDSLICKAVCKIYKGRVTETGYANLRAKLNVKNK